MRYFIEDGQGTYITEFVGADAYSRASAFVKGTDFEIIPAFA